MGLFGEYALRTIGVTGPVNSGKTVFGLSISPDCLDKSGERPPRTLVIDDEGSSEPFRSLFNFDRWDLQRLIVEVGGEFCNFFPHLEKKIAEIKPGAYDVLCIDTIDTFTLAHSEWAEAHPEFFGKTAAQKEKMGGVYIQLIKNDIKRLIERVFKPRFEVVCWMAHHRKVWEGNKPTNRVRPQGMDTWMAEAALYLNLERPKAPNTGIPSQEPVGTLLKSRCIARNAKGELHDMFPPRISPCTPDKIREYVSKPFDVSKPKASEKSDVSVQDGEIVRELSQDDRLQLETAKAEAELARNRSALELMERAREARGKVVAAKYDPVVTVDVGDAQPAEATAPVTPTTTPATTLTPTPPRATTEQQSRLIELKQLCKLTKEQWDDGLHKNYKADSVAQLSPDQATEMIGKLEAFAAKKGLLGK